MRINFLGSSVRRSSGVLLALVAWAVIAPGNAQAGCNQHWETRPPSQGVASLYPEVLGLVDQIEVEAESGSLPYRPRPCSGPSCSKNPAAPTGQTLVVERLVPNWADLPCSADEPGLQSSWLRVADPVLAPACSVASIFHPPRQVN